METVILLLSQSDKFLHDNMEKMHICDDSDWKKIKKSLRESSVKTLEYVENCELREKT